MKFLYRLKFGIFMYIWDYQDIQLRLIISDYLISGKLPPVAADDANRRP